MGVIVNTGRKIFELVIGSVWKSREKCVPARHVLIDHMTRTHVVVHTIGSKRRTQIHLQDFVARFDLVEEGQSAVQNVIIKKGE